MVITSGSAISDVTEDANGLAQFRLRDSPHPRRQGRPAVVGRRCPSANRGPRSTRQWCSVHAESPGFRPRKAEMNSPHEQRSDYKFISKAASACESRIRKFQKPRPSETFSVVPKPKPLNPRCPISIYSGSKACVRFTTIPLFYRHICPISAPGAEPRITDRAAMPKG